MRILCVSAQLPGHLDWGGYLATAAALARRGHTVVWASGQEVAKRIEQAGIPFHALSETGWRWPPPPPLTAEQMPTKTHLLQRERQVRALDQWLVVDRVQRAVNELHTLTAAFRPDLILSEMFIAASGLVAEANNLPFAIIGWPAPKPQNITGADEMAMIARQRLQTLLAQNQLHGTNWTQSGPPALCSPLTHITYWSPSWFAGMAVGPQTKHFGGLRPPILPNTPLPTLPNQILPQPEDTPWVLITLGTSFNVDPNFFIAAAHAVAQLGCLPLIALGAPLETEWVQKMRVRLPQSAILTPHLNFATFLPHVAAAIHHGGAGTTHALVAHAIPQIVVPHAADQTRQAQGIMRSGVGHFLPAKDVTIPRLVEVLAAILPDRAEVRANAIALQAEFDALGGVPAAASTIEALV